MAKNCTYWFTDNVDVLRPRPHLLGAPASKTELISGFHTSEQNAATERIVSAIANVNSLFANRSEDTSELVSSNLSWTLSNFQWICYSLASNEQMWMRILLIAARMLLIFPFSIRYRASVCLLFPMNNSLPSASSGQQLAIRSKLFAVFHSLVCTSL